MPGHSSYGGAELSQRMLKETPNGFSSSPSRSVRSPVMISCQNGPTRSSSMFGRRRRVARTLYCLPSPVLRIE